MKFQNELNRYEYMRSKENHSANINSTKETLTSLSCLFKDNTYDPTTNLVEVPTIQYLKDQVGKFLSLSQYHLLPESTSNSWNQMFHHVLNICQLKLEFPPNSLPPSYGKKQSCGHLLNVELDTISTKALYLTMLEKVLVKAEKYLSKQMNHAYS